MSPRIKICKEPDCNDQATTKGYCRFHYLKNWSNVRHRKRRAVQDLNRYVEQVAKKHPEDFISEISKDLNRWQDGDGTAPAVEGYLDEFSNTDSMDTIIDNLKVDEDY